MRSKLVWLGAWSILLAPPALGTEAPVSARQSMHALVKALKQGDLEGAERLSLGHTAFSSLSKRRVDREEYRQRLRGFLGGMSRELSRGVELSKAVCADVLILPAGDKTRQEVTMAVIHASFRVQGKPVQGGPMPFLFVSHQGTWKFFLRK